MTACSLLHLLLLIIVYLTMPKDLTKQHFCNYSEENSVSGEVSKIEEYQIKIGRVRCGIGFCCYTYSHTHSEDSIVAYV